MTLKIKIKLFLTNQNLILYELFQFLVGIDFFEIINCSFSCHFFLNLNREFCKNNFETERKLCENILNFSNIPALNVFS